MPAVKPIQMAGSSGSFMMKPAHNSSTIADRTQRTESSAPTTKPASAKTSVTETA